jgi:hypothetical protein
MANTETTKVTRDIVILSIPRIAPVRPSSAPAVLKALCTKVGKSSQVLDLNHNFFTSFFKKYPSVAKELDDYFVQFNLTLSIDTQQIYTNWIAGWVERIVSYDPEIVCISIFSWQSQRFGLDLLKQLRPAYSGIISIGGQGLVNSQNMSSHWTVPTYAESLLSEKLIDYYMKGESEETFPRFILGERNLPGLNNSQTSVLHDMSQSPLLDFSDTDVSLYQNGYEGGVLPVESGRGCVRSCAFCEMSSEHGVYRRKNGQQLADEIIYYYEIYKTRHYYFHDDLINGNLDDFNIFVDAILKYYQDNNLPDRHFTFSGYWIVRKEKQFGFKDFEKFYRAGGETLVTGVETGSDRLRKVMRKGFTNKDLEFNLECISQLHMKFYFMLIAGLPGEQIEDFNETLNALTKWQKYVATGAIIGINLGTTATVEPGTDIYENYHKYKLVGLKGQRPIGINWMCTETPDLDYRERVRRRVILQEHVLNLKYPLWKGDDHLRIIIDKYKENIELWEA